MTKVRVTSDAPTRVRTANGSNYSTYLAPRGPGPDPWMEPAQVVTVSGDVTIDYHAGKHCILNVTGDITSLTVINWPASGRIARLTLEFVNTGLYGILAWDPAYYWPDGVVPDITQGAGKRDRVILSTTDGGTVVYGDSVGFDYRTV